jgi:hypothetical protein
MCGERAGGKRDPDQHRHTKVLVADTTAGGVEQTMRTITINPVKPKHKHKQ